MGSPSRNEVENATPAASHEVFREFAPYPYLSLTGSGAVRAANDAWLDRLGYERSDVEGEQFEEFLTPESRARFAAAAGTLSAEGRVSDVTLELVREDGSTVEVAFDGRAEYDEEGALRGTHCAVRVREDVADAGESAGDQRDWAEQVFEAAGTLLVVLDLDGRVRRINERGCRTLGYDREELLGADWFETVVPEAEQVAISDVFDSLRSADGQSIDICENPVVTKTGETRIIKWHNTPLCDADGNIAAVVSSGTDVTEHKHKERALEESRARYESLFENNPLVIWEEDFSAAKRRLDALASEVDSLETYLEANPDEVRRLLGMIEVIDVNQNAVEYYGASSKADLFDELDRVFTDAAYENFRSQLLAIAAGETRFRMETVARTLDGERREELLEMYVPEAHAEDYSRIYVTTTDITERKRQERELRRKNERLDEFAGVISHDLRNPLTVAQGRAALVREERESEHVRALVDALDRMETIVEDTLTLARQGDTVAETEPVSLVDLVGRCWGMVDTAGATLDVVDEVTVRGDSDRLQHVFENLFRNSVEHSSTRNRSQPGDSVEHSSTRNRSQPGDSAEHSSTSNRSQPGDSAEHSSTSNRPEPDDADEHGTRGVTVRFGRAGEDTIYVEDDGPGIPAAERERVFEPGHSSTPGGTGLGLTIVRRVAEAHGWTVSLRESDDGGARFEFSGVDVVS